MPARQLHRLALLACALFLPACGRGDRDAAPPADPAGAPANGVSDSPATPPEPAHLKEALAVINLSNFPIPDGAVGIDKSPIHSAYRVANGDAEKVADFYRGKLAQLGWKPAPEPAFVKKTGAELLFMKQGFVLYASMGVSPVDGTLNGVVLHVGNVDARSLPRLPDVKLTSSMAQRVIYSAAGKPDDVRKLLRTEMKKQPAWKEFSPSSVRGAPAEIGGAFKELHYLNHAIKADIILSPTGDRTDVFCSVGLVKEELPVPPDAETLEFDEDPLYFYFYTRAKIEPVVDFYRKELTALDWKLRPNTESPDKMTTLLVFEAPERQPIKLELVRDQGDRVTTVRIMRWKPAGK